MPDPRQRGVRYSEKSVMLAIARQQAMLEAQARTVVLTARTTWRWPVTTTRTSAAARRGGT